MAIPLLLQPKSLLGLYEKYGNETPCKVLDFFPDRPATEPGQSVQYDTIKYTTDVARINVRGGDPNAVKPAVRGSVIGRAITLSEEIIIPPTVVKDLRDAGSNAPAGAQAYVARAMKQLRIRVAKRKALMAAQCLGTASGLLSFTPTGAAAAETVDLNYTTAHKTWSTAMSTAGTDVMGTILSAKLLIVQDGGKTPTEMVLNSVVGNYLATNTKILSILSDVAKDKLRETGRISRLCELDVHYIDDTYTVEGASSTKVLPDAFCAIFAGDNSDRGMIEMAPASLLAPDSHRGMFFHVKEGTNINDPITVQYEYNFFPMLANPDEVVYDVNVNG
jgi:hypothetical protein